MKDLFSFFIGISVVCSLQNLGMLCSASAAFTKDSSAIEEWTTVAPREEIRPEFQRLDGGGRSGQGSLIIQADDREGLHAWWQKTFWVTPGRHYRFSVWRRTENIAVPRCSVLKPDFNMSTTRFTR